MITLRALWRLARLFEHLLTGALLSVLPRGPHFQGMRITQPGLVQWWHRRLCRILHLHVHREGPLPGSGALVVSNHVSWLDIPVLGSCVKGDFVAKSEVRGWPAIGWLAARSGTLFIRRGAHQSLGLVQMISARLQAGRSVMLFPEGTTTDGRGLRRFFPRLLAPALETGAAVIPVALRYASVDDGPGAAPFVDDDPFLSHLWRVVREPRLDVRVCFCDPLAAGGQTRSALSAQAEAAVRRTLEGMPDTPPEPRGAV